jgi:GT2 family glycosyltransferase
VFVDRPLPRHLKAGHTLGDADVALVKRLLLRRDLKLHHLYDRTIWLSNEVARLETQVNGTDGDRGDAPVDIVVPIFNARQHVRRCLESVRRHATGDWRLILVDDASTDAALVDELRALAASDARILYLANDRNRGFTHTANRGMRQRDGRDVLLLNSDTEVFAGFLDRLRRDAYVDGETGIVGPLSNNATHCSIPEWLRENPIPEGWDAESLAALIAATSRRELPEMVTAVGFCMYVRGSVFDDVGYFDEETFGRGYCEEIDFCERAKLCGYRVRLADDVFVWHAGKASFGDEGRARQTDNFRLLEPKHPSHVPDYLRFVEENPFQGIQRDVRFYLKRARRGATPAVLHLFSSNPFDGGDLAAASQLRQLAALRQERMLLAFPRDAELIVAEVFDGAKDERFEYRFSPSNPAPELCVRHAELDRFLNHWVALFGVSALHGHGLRRWPIDTIEALTAELPVFIDFVDYYPVCAGGYLFDEARGDACAGEACACRTPGLSGPESERLRERHTETFRKLLSRAHLLFPSTFARDKVRHRVDMSQARTHVVEPTYLRHASSPRSSDDGALQLGLVGNFSHVAAGRERYQKLFEATRGRAVEWHIFTAGFEDPSNGMARVHSLCEPSAQLAAVDAVVTLPAWAEPYSHALSASLAAGRPAIVSDRGEAAERVRSTNAGVVVSSVAEAIQAIERLVGDRAELARLTRLAGSVPLREPDRTLRALYEETAPAAFDARLTADRLQELADRVIRPVS